MKPRTAVRTIPRPLVCARFTSPKGPCQSLDPRHARAVPRSVFFKSTCADARDRRLRARCQVEWPIALTAADDDVPAAAVGPVEPNSRIDRPTGPPLGGVGMGRRGLRSN